MKKKVALIVAGIIFLLAALVHLVRLSTHFRIIIGDHTIPDATSWYGLIIGIILAIWMFVAAKGK
jgi:hypothetical protein